MIGCIENVKLEAISTTVSKNRIPIEERCKHLITPKQAKRMTKGTGISKVSVVDEGICTSDLCFNSAEKLFSEFGYDKSEIGALIFLTQTPDYPAPATAYILQDRLKLPKDIICFDVNLGCSGFTYGIYLSSMILSNTNRKVLFLCGDVTANQTNPNETAGMAISADAGVAAIFGKCDDGRKIFYNIDSYGDKANYLIALRGGARANKITDEFGNLKTIKENYSQMDGTGVLDFALEETPKNIERLLDYAKMKIDEIELGLFHQAEKIMVDSLGSKFEMDSSRAPFKCGTIGNVSSATIPICLTEMKKDNEFKEYHKALLSGFGIGMSVASVIMDISDLKVLETLEI